MAEERGATMVGGVEAEIRNLAKDVTDLKVSMGRMEGRFEQMDKRLGNIETTVGDLRRDIRQVFYFVGGAVVVPILIEVFRRVVH